jgi:peptidoglycan/LPS O-acetylase OafA/YrhL
MASLGPLRWLGKYSYGMYLLHQPVCCILLASGAWSSLRPAFIDSSFFWQIFYNFALPFPITALLALGLWHVWERPFLALKDRVGSSMLRKQDLAA